MASIRMRLAGGMTGGLGVAALAFAAGVATPAMAQTAGAGGGAEVTVQNPARLNLMRLGRRITIDLTDQRLEDVLNFIVEVTGADIEPVWTSDTAEGLDREARITLKATNLPALTLLERVLEKAQTDFSQNTWQLTSYGSVEVGPKERLNRNKRLVIYDVNDLLTELPRFYDAPQIDLQGVLQQSQGGGGGGQSPFTQINQDQQQEEEAEQRRMERVQRLIDLITTLVETEQWQDNGGDGGTIRYFQGTLVINAPDYMHRQINGYSFWPERSVQRAASGRRYVSLNMDTGVSTLDGFGREPVTAVVGGRLIRSDGGGGGSTQKPGQGQQPGGEKPGSGGEGGGGDKPDADKPK